jgi:hypothetical protein
MPGTATRRGAEPLTSGFRGAMCPASLLSEGRGLVKDRF